MIQFKIDRDYIHPTFSFNPEGIIKKQLALVISTMMECRIALCTCRLCDR